MTIAAIIAEYNPFHNGHEYMIQKVKEETGADYVIAVMSGDFTQRGIPGIADKHTRAKMAVNCGISEDKSMIDPGIGFAKSYEQNLTVLKHLEVFRTLKYPVFIGASNKSVIGTALDLPVGERLEGTLATSALAVVKGCAFVRVHDVRANLRVVKMLQTIIDKG